MKKRLPKAFNAGGIGFGGLRIPGPTVPAGEPSFHCPNCKRPANADVVCAACGYELVPPKRRKRRGSKA